MKKKERVGRRGRRRGGWGERGRREEKRIKKKLKRR